jgi:hypothetical protein
LATQAGEQTIVVSSLIGGVARMPGYSVLGSVSGPQAEMLLRLIVAHAEPGQSHRIRLVRLHRLTSMGRSRGRVIHRKAARKAGDRAE